MSSSLSKSSDGLAGSAVSLCPAFASATAAAKASARSASPPVSIGSPEPASAPGATCAFPRSGPMFTAIFRCVRPRTDGAEAGAPRVNTGTGGKGLGRLGWTTCQLRSLPSAMNVSRGPGSTRCFSGSFRRLHTCARLLRNSGDGRCAMSPLRAAMLMASLVSSTDSSALPQWLQMSVASSKVSERKRCMNSRSCCGTPFSYA
mmetsp:Transcript_26035/g.87248  ORF Transcript_26035/g.87248 Transcript_26035/m.87248 type:complete len:203 (+) Transcript_26035:150-758(+)